MLVLRAVVAGAATFRVHCKPRNADHPGAPSLRAAAPLLQGLFELAAKTYAARRTMQGSLDGADEVALADILAADLATSGASSNGNGSSSSRGSGSSRAKSRRSRSDRAPSVREEIDAW
jgi:hypothetical protein